MSRKRTVVFSVVVMSAALSVARPSMAQEEPAAGDVGAARSLAQEGTRLADAGNCAEAIDKLSRAEKLYHAPMTLTRLGECQVQLGRLVEGTEHLSRVAHETLPATASAAFVQAQERARKLLAETKPRLARLKIAVAAPGDAQFSVKLDGQAVPIANLNMNRPVDPGEHHIEVTGATYKPASARVRLAEGGVDSVAITLEIDPNAPKPAPASAAGPPSAAGDAAGASSGGSSRTPAYVALGIGVAGLGVGAVTGLMALGKKSDLDDACGPSKATCPTNSQDTVDSGKTLGTVSTIGFGVGVVGLAVGGYFLLTSGSGASPSQRASAKRAATRVLPVLGPTSVGVHAIF